MSDMFGLVSKKDSQKVPLKSVKCCVAIEGFTADVTATLEYSNEEVNPIEAIFVFPLDEQAAVYGFQATIDGRTIVGEVQEKQEARDTYDDAVSSGHSAFLMEESDESSDIFRISVGNLPPQKSATVELRLVTELEVQEGGAVVFVLPTVLNPRYSPASNPSPGVSGTIPRLPASVGSPYTFDFMLTVHSASEITAITSPSNSLSVQLNAADKSRADVKLAEAHQFDKDVVVHVMTKEPFKPHALVELGSANPNKAEKASADSYLEKPVVMLNFLPHFEAPDESPSAGEFVFIVDRSGSMGGERIRSAAETLLLFLKSLPNGCYFNVIGFGSSFTKLFKKSLPYDDQSLNAACDSCVGLRADLGGTEILSPLQWVFSQPSIRGHPRQVFLLTDGEVSNTDNVIAEVRRNAATTRCFTFGVGHGASTALVKGVARAGKGTAEFIKPGERMQKKVIKTLKHALQPVLNDVTVTWDLGADWSVQQSPASLPPVFLGDRLVVYGVVDVMIKEAAPREGSARLRYTMEKNTIEHTIKFSAPAVASKEEGVASTLHRLAAKGLIQEKQDAQAQAGEREKESIISISKASNVVSKHTAFVAVDKESREPVRGALQSRPVPLPFRGSAMLLCGVGGGPSPPGMSSNYVCMSAPMPMRTKSCAVSPQQDWSNLGHAPPPPAMGGMMQQCAAQPRLLDDWVVADSGLDSCSTQKSAGAPPRQKGAPKSRRKKRARAAAAPTATERAGSEQLDTVLRLVQLQKASGSWEFTDELGSVCGRTSSVLLESCPAGVPRDTQAGKDLWATALALTLLAGKYWDRQDEWEMIADKGKRWLRSNVPRGVQPADVLQAAAKTLGVKLQDSI